MQGPRDESNGKVETIEKGVATSGPFPIVPDGGQRSFGNEKCRTGGFGARNLKKLEAQLPELILRYKFSYGADESIHDIDEDEMFFYLETVNRHFPNKLSEMDFSENEDIRSVFSKVVFKIDMVFDISMSDKNKDCLIRYTDTNDIFQYRVFYFP